MQNGDPRLKPQQCSTGNLCQEPTDSNPYEQTDDIETREINKDPRLDLDDDEQWKHPPNNDGTTFNKDQPNDETDYDEEQSDDR